MNGTLRAFHSTEYCNTFIRASLVLNPINRKRLSVKKRIEKDKSGANNELVNNKEKPKKVRKDIGKTKDIKKKLLKKLIKIF